LYVLPWGWFIGPIYFNINFYLVSLDPLVLPHFTSPGVVYAGVLPFIMPKVPANKRIGAHNIDIISVIIGNMLGDGWAEYRSGNTRFHIHMGSPNVEYLMYLHTYYRDRGYCSEEKPKLKRNLNKGNKIYFSYKFRTWTYSNFNWIYEAFYNNGKKIIPSNIYELLNPLTLAIWIMDDGGTHPSGLILSTYAFELKEVQLLTLVLKMKFSLETSIVTRKAGHIIYIPKSQMNLLNQIVGPYIIPCMSYKLHNKPRQSAS
jgi:hypothetical protein